MNATQLKDCDVSTDITIQGTCDERFRELRDLFARNLATGEDVGASAAVFIDGEPVVDIWGGHVDEERTRPWNRDTIVNNFSTTKTMTALVALILADRGELDLNAPVTKYWPEFAPYGKGSITTSQFLGHTAGMPGWTETMTLAARGSGREQRPRQRALGCARAVGALVRWRGGRRSSALPSRLRAGFRRAG